MNKYFEIGSFYSPRTNAKKILPISATRGCPEGCKFCSSHGMWGRKVRWRKISDIHDEIKAMIELHNGLDEIQIIDDNITANIKSLYELCDVLENLGIRWCTPNGTKANYHMSKQIDYYKRMKKAGCYQITIAIETGNQHIMDSIGKNLKIYEAAKAVENAKKAGLFVHTLWMVGFPSETREEMESSMTFAASLGADSYSVSILSPIPGSDIYRQAVRENLFWENVENLKNARFNTSLLKVEGFSNHSEFESWVNLQNYRLNELLSKRDPKRYEEYELLRNPKLKGLYSKQT